MFGHAETRKQRLSQARRINRPLSLESLENRQLLAELAQLRLEATDLSGQPVTTLLQGQEYYLNALVKDLRATPVGVFSAYFDLSVNDNGLISVVDQAGGLGGVLFSPSYLDGRSAANAIETPAKEISEAGAFTQEKYFGAETPLFKMRFKADALGTVQFGTNAAEDFGKVFALRQLGTISSSEVSFGSLTLNIVSQVSLTNDVATVAEDAAATTLSVLNNDVGGAAAWTIQSVSDISSGGTVLVANGGKSISYKPAPDFFGTETFKYLALNNGVPGEATVTVTVTPVNDAPRNQIPAANLRVTSEDTALAFSQGNGNAISIWDDLVAGGSDRVVLTAVDGGLITLPNLASLINQGKITLEAGANSSTTMQIRGLTADINAALDGLQFTPKQDFFTVAPSQLARIRLQTSEFGSPAPLLQADSTFDITVNSVNDAPVNVVPAAQIADSITRSLTFGSTNRITVSDVDVGAGKLSVTLSVNSGILTLATTTGLLFNPGSVNKSASMTFSGTPAAINTALLNLKYTGNVGVTSDLLTINTNDLGNSGAGGAKADIDTVSISIPPVNQAPVNTVPGAQIYTAANRTITFDSTKRISTNDVDAAANPLKITLSVVNGVVQLGSTNGITITGGADNTKSVIFQGNQTDVNNALLNLKYVPNAATTTDTLTIDTNDLGNTGSGGAKSDKDTVALSLAANTAPINTVPGAQLIPALNNRKIIFDATRLISTNDADVGQNKLSVSLTVVGGVLKLGSLTGLTFITGADNTKAMKFEGTQTDVNNALLNMSYVGNLATLTDTLTIDVNDLGNSGAGGAKSDKDTVKLTIAPNTAPVNTVPLAQTYTAAGNRTVTFDATKLIKTTDADVGASNLRVTLSVASGILQLGSLTGLTFISGANNTKTMQFEGTQADVNNALLDMSYVAGAATLADTLTIDVNDLGNSGAGGAKSDKDTVKLSLAPNAAPINTVPLAQTYTAAGNRTVVFDTTKLISTTDLDVGSSKLRVTLSVTAGVLSLGSLTGLTFITGANNTKAMQFEGTQVDVNNALLNLTYVANAATLTDTLTVDVNDLGNTGAGGAKSDKDTVKLSLAANQAPVNSVPGPQSFTGANRVVLFDATKRLSTNDPDVGASKLQVTVSVVSGVLNLGSITDITFVGLSKNNTKSLVFQGTQAAVNNALLNLTYTANSNIVSDVLTLLVNDLGNTGAGGAKSDTDKVTLTLNASSGFSRSAGGGSGESGSRNAPASIASRGATTATDQLFASPTASQATLPVNQASSTSRLVELLASRNLGRSKVASSTDSIFGE